MNTRKTLFWVTLFSIAMGFLETAVVVYLRQIYYPLGFNFPLAPMHHDIVVVEVWREVATIIMLAAIGILAGKNRAEKFAWFLFAFAIWDIFYYVFLWVFLGWPQTLFTWDVLFLIPVPWVGPVLSPVIIALTMILYALSIVYYCEKGKNVALNLWERILLYMGCVVTIVAFTEDFARQQGDILFRNLRQGGSLFIDCASYIPAHFDWLLFWIGEILILVAGGIYVRRLSGSKGELP